MYSAAAICRSTHLPIPQEGRIITSDDVFGHLPDIRCINGGIDAAPAPPLDGAGQCAGLPGVLSEAGGRLPLHPKTQSGRKVFWTAGQRNFFWRRCHAVARHL